MLILVAQFILLGFYYGLNSKEREYNAFIDGVPFEEVESESNRIFWTAILTSWVSPTTVWSNNIINKCSLEDFEQKSDLEWSPMLHVLIGCFNFLIRLWRCFKCLKDSKDPEENIFFEKTQTYKNRSKILFVSGFVTNFILVVSFLIVFAVLHKTNELSFSIEENPPITQCLKKVLSNWTTGYFKISAPFL